MQIEIKPLDTLFFRDGKPFSMGEETWADSIFPPSPSVFYGALRTAYFANHPHDISKANTTDDPTKDLKIKGIYYSINNDNYFPLPYDCVKEKDNKNEKIFSLKLEKKSNLISNYPLEYMLQSDNNKKIENIDNALFSLSQLEKYLKSTIDNLDFIKISDYLAIPSTFLN